MTSVWWWPVPADGEIVPDHPPVELTAYLTEDGLDPPEPRYHEIEPFSSIQIQIKSDPPEDAA